MTEGGRSGRKLEKTVDVIPVKQQKNEVFPIMERLDVQLCGHCLGLFASHYRTNGGTGTDTGSPADEVGGQCIPFHGPHDDRGGYCPEGTALNS